jgi:hypothetical protein
LVKASVRDEQSESLAHAIHELVAMSHLGAAADKHAALTQGSTLSESEFSHPPKANSMALAMRNDGSFT